MTLIEALWVVLTVTLAAVGVVVGYRALGPIGDIVGVLLPLPLWLVVPVTAAIQARRDRTPPLASARLQKRRRIFS